MEHYPKYYEQFRCIASRCPDSCCQEWQVDVDEQTAKKYLSMTGDLGQQLRKVMTKSADGWILPITQGRCPMWRTDGLCEIQAQAGHDALCHTCREFPRLCHEYEEFTERDLELSCPEAARLIFTAEDAWVGEVSSNDEVMGILLDSRRDALEFLQKPGLGVQETLANLLVYAHHVQSWIDGGEPAQINPKQTQDLMASLDGLGDITSVFGFYVNLEILTDRWKERLCSPLPAPQWDHKLLRFLAYGIRRYWLQAISDYDLLCRVKFLISAAILLAHLDGDLVQTAQLWSKEIENDPDNVEALLDGAYTSHAFTDQNLLSLLKG